MKKLAIPVDEIRNGDQKYCGGKASALGMMKQHHLNVPYAVCITTEAYNEYVNRTGLKGRILIELSRKHFEDMRWEEMWDVSQKIKNMLATTPLPEAMYQELKATLESKFDKDPVVVRSSSVSEDSPYTSFAGVHESYVNIRGIDSILEHIRLVWASLWSDSAMLYRKEMGLDTQKSAMAVVVQDIVIGESSGVVFTMSPYNENETIIEAVYGLNEGLVDGTVEPDRWILDRETGTLKSHNSVLREKAVFPSEDGGITLTPLPVEMIKAPPLKEEDVNKIYMISKNAENLFKVPQDVEWTVKDNTVYVLQSRPITTLEGQDKNKKRLWYISLRRSFENLRELRKKIEDRYIPEMIDDAKKLESQDIFLLSDDMIADEIERRTGIYQKWNDIYWQEFIPLAHGVRLFGRVYNDTLNPKDPFEFVDLLSGADMISTERNNNLEEIARVLREDPALLEKLKTNTGFTVLEFDNKIEEFIVRFGGKYSEHPEMKKGLINLILEMAVHEPVKQKKYTERIHELENIFLSHFKDEKRTWAEELLDLGRISYKLRDDDNIYLGRIEAQMNRAINEAKKRLKERNVHLEGRISTQELIKTLKDPYHQPEEDADYEKSEATHVLGMKARQLLGNPAGKGVAKGKARVIRTHADLFNVKSGEILVCDSVDPNMTFVVPLCSGIVERRGGMLIHGAIIAREYGLPCITGVPDVLDHIKTGDYILVDGFLGIVTILRRSGYIHSLKNIL